MNRAFEGDPMMSELHEIRERHYRQAKFASVIERNDRRVNRLVKFLSSYGYTLIPTKRGTRKLVRSPR